MKENKWRREEVDREKGRRHEGSKRGAGKERKERRKVVTLELTKSHLVLIISFHLKSGPLSQGTLEITEWSFEFINPFF